MKSSTSP